MENPTNNNTQSAEIIDLNETTPNETPEKSGPTEEPSVKSPPRKESKSSVPIQSSSKSSWHSNCPYSFQELLAIIWRDRYVWLIVKSVCAFLLALKIAQECKHINIPLKDYVPFASTEWMWHWDSQ